MELGKLYKTKTNCFIYSVDEIPKVFLMEDFFSYKETFILLLYHKESSSRNFYVGLFPNGFLYEIHKSNLKEINE